MRKLDRTLMLPSAAAALLLGASSLAGAQEPGSEIPPAETPYQATQRSPASPQMWDPERLEEGLTNAGFSDFSNMRQEGDVWQFSASQDGGESMEYSFDPASGEITDAESQVVGTLTAETPYHATQMNPASAQMWDPEIVEGIMANAGFSNFTDARREGDLMRFSASQDGGEAMEYSLDPKTGEVMGPDDEVVGTLVFIVPE